MMYIYIYIYIYIYYIYIYIYASTKYWDGLTALLSEMNTTNIYASYCRPKTLKDTPEGHAFPDLHGTDCGEANYPLNFFGKVDTDRSYTSFARFRSVVIYPHDFALMTFYEWPVGLVMICHDEFSGRCFAKQLDPSDPSPNLPFLWVV